MSQVISFAEESCWDGETFRSVRREVVFVVAGHAIKTGVPIRHEFRADYGLWYDFEDTVLLDILKRERPDVDWGWFVYHKLLDHSGIHIYNPDTNRVVGSIFPRGRRKQNLSGENAGGNITPIGKGREYREIRRARDAAKTSGEEEGDR